MRYLFRTLWFLIPGALLPFATFAQGPSSCFNALPLCQTTFTQPVGPIDVPPNLQVVNNNLSCLGQGEKKAQWYIFTAQTSGDVCFAITPVNGSDDYDYAVYNLTNADCGDIGADPSLEVSCNYSANLGCGGVTGPTGQNLPGNPCGGQVESCIPVQAGETYAVVVSNWTPSSTSGYGLDFAASTASIVDNTPPALNQVQVGCGTSDINISFSENVTCASVDPSDFTLTGPGGVYTITAVTSTECQIGGDFDNQFSVTVSPTITTPGNYTFSLVGLVEDNCGNPATLTAQTLPFSGQFVNIAPGQNNICAGTPTTLTTNLSGLSAYTFDWTPGNLTSPSPTVSPNVTTTYTVTATGPGGCVLTDDVTILVNPTPQATFTTLPQTCINAGTNITYTGSAGGTANYFWNFDNGAVNTGSGGGPYNVTWNTAGPKTISLTVEKDGCISTPFTQAISVEEIPTSAFAFPSEVCLNSVAVFTYQGNAPSSATFNWTFPGATYTNGQIGPYNISWNTPGTKQVCLQVENAGCFSSFNCQDVTVRPAQSTSIASVADQCFSGNSFTFTPTGDTADFYLWDFGASALPPQFTGPTPPPVTYQTPGTKTVRLVAGSAGCSPDTSFVTFDVIEEPSSAFSSSTTNSCSGGTVNFTYQGTVLGPNQTFLWDFGPGAIPTSSTLQTPPTVTYTSGGTKSVTLTVTNRGCSTQTTQDITVNGSPVASAGPDREFCEGDGGVQLDATVTGGTMPYFYNWTCNISPNCGIDSVDIEDPKVNPNVINPTEDVTYYFEVIDVNGCSSGLDSVVVTVKAKPKMDAGVDTSICPNPAPGIFLTGTLAANNNAPEPVIYQWTPSSGLNDPNVPNPFARPDTTIIYTLIGTSINGCSSDANTIDPLSTVTVTVLPNPIVEAGVDTGLCFGESIQLQGFATGAGPNYEFTWSPATGGTISDPNSPNPNVNPAATTTYTLSVTSNGCSGADSVEVQVDTKPTVTASNNRDLCEGETITLSAVANGDPNATIYNFLWSPGRGLSDSTIASPEANPAVSTTYNVIASTEFGCISNVDSTVLTVLATPQVDLLQPDTTICAGDEIPLVAAHTFNGDTVPTQYAWLPTEFVDPAIGDSIVMVNPISSTVIEVRASSFAGKCFTMDQVVIEVNPAVVADIQADTALICGGDTATLVALGGLGNADYAWSPAMSLTNPTSQSTFALPDTTTTYQLIVAEGVCADTATLDVTVRPTPSNDYFVDQTEGCGSLTASFQENSTADAISFIWDFGDGTDLVNSPNPLHTFAQPGSYQVTFTAIGASGCNARNNLVTVNVSDLPLADFTTDPIGPVSLPLPNATVNFTDASLDAVRWFWDFGDGKVSTETSPRHIYQEPGNYTVTLVVQNVDGCVDTAQQSPVEIFEPSLKIPNVFSPNGDGRNDRFQILFDGTAPVTTRIYDRWGRTVFEAEAIDQTWDGRNADGSNHPVGVYYYAVTVNGLLYKGSLTLLR
ncbi:MAG: PKD domain-containing protein [Bacteroidota bacterium]